MCLAGLSRCAGLARTAKRLEFSRLEKRLRVLLLCDQLPAPTKGCRSLVFIAALTPDAGETVGAVFTREKPHPEAPQLAPDRHGFIWMPDERFAAAFCQNASPEQAALLAATQRPIALACIQEKSPKPAWKAKPSWYLVAHDDRMINPATQLFLAQRMGAQTRSEKIDHTLLVTAPKLVVEMILQAVTGSAARPNR